MIAGLIARLRAHAATAEAPEDLARTWRARYEAFRERVRARKLRERGELEALKAQNARRARRVPSVAVLQHMVRGRLAMAQRRAAGLGAPPASSKAADLEGRARRVVIDGVTWWVPTPRTQSARSVTRTLLKQRFPYRTISQTRDVALGGVMLDIGANVGRTAIPRAILGDATRVFCAEPDELNFDCLVANVTDNGLAGLVVPDRVAVSDRVGWLPLVHGKMSGSHRIAYEASASAAMRVPCTTLDRWVEHHQIQLADVTFVKVDTQGSEVRVLAGASQLLAQPHIAWQIEVSPFHLRLAGSDSRALYDVLSDRFSHFFDLSAEAAGPRLRPVSELVTALAYLEREEPAHTDIVVYRAGR